MPLFGRLLKDFESYLKQWFKDRETNYRDGYRDNNLCRKINQDREMEAEERIRQERKDKLQANSWKLITAPWETRRHTLMVCILGLLAQAPVFYTIALAPDRFDTVLEGIIWVTSFVLLTITSGFAAFGVMIAWEVLKKKHHSIRATACTLIAWPLVLIHWLSRIDWLDIFSEMPDSVTKAKTSIIKTFKED